MPSWKECWQVGRHRLAVCEVNYCILELIDIFVEGIVDIVEEY